MIQQFKKLLKFGYGLALLTLYGHKLYGIPAPLFIGGSGGSGTRVVVEIVKHLGFFMGSALNYENDSKTVGVFVRKWIPNYLELKGKTMPGNMKARMDRDFKVAQLRHRRTIPDPNMPWGVKNPRGYILWPYFHEVYPQAKFIHVVRDGRDMAFSKNNTQLEKYGMYYLPPELDTAPLPVRLIACWSAINLSAARLGQEKLKDNYLLVRFEDMCNHPNQTVEQINDFLGIPKNETAFTRAAAGIKRPDSIGRWRSQDPDLLPELLSHGRPGLEYFGYWDGKSF